MNFLPLKSSSGMMKDKQFLKNIDEIKILVMIDMV